MNRKQAIAQIDSVFAQLKNASSQERQLFCAHICGGMRSVIANEFQLSLFPAEIAQIFRAAFGKARHDCAKHNRHEVARRIITP